MQLAVLAAGLGERFGGPKQLFPVGPSGEAILDYTAHDALAVGFEEIVLVIRPELEPAVSSMVNRWPRPPTLVFQEADLRGTAHAVLAAREAVKGEFAVANADDLYGREALRAVRNHLASTAGRAPDEHAVVAFPIGESFIGKGPVRRAVCEVAPGGLLSSIDERQIVRGEDGSLAGAAPTSHVSMNLWGFHPGIWRIIEMAAERRAHDRGASPDRPGELLLPDVVGKMLGEGGMRVRVLRQAGGCVGLTNAEDVEGVAAEVRSLTEHGVYPPKLWSGA